MFRRQLKIFLAGNKKRVDSELNFPADPFFYGCRATCQSIEHVPEFIEYLFFYRLLGLEIGRVF